MECPQQEQMVAVKHLLRYISGSLDYGLYYHRGSGGTPGVLGYSDSDMAGDIDDSKSTSGMLFFLDNNHATWNSQKQRIATLSSYEAEYIAGTGAACQVVWLRRLMEEVLGKKVAAPRIKIDNQSTIALGKNHVLHDRSKHIKMKYHFIRECVEQGEISLEFVGTHDQLAYILMKPLARVRFQELRRRIGVVKLSSIKALN
jgi:hypothetical protein